MGQLAQCTGQPQIEVNQASLLVVLLIRPRLRPSVAISDVELLA
jgi:hypothetical protein